MSTALTVLVLEDDTTDARILESTLSDLGYQLSGIADNLQSALGLYYSNLPDVVIIDVLLHGKRDGITFAQTINDTARKRRPFVYLTNMSDRETFEAAKQTSPASYLLKPFNRLELQYAIELAVETFNGDPGGFALSRSMLVNDFLFVKKGPRLIKVDLSKISHIEVEGKYSTVYTSEERFVIQSSLKELLVLLPENLFLQVHRNYLVNMIEIRELHLEDNQLVLNHYQLPVSRRYKELLVERFRALK